MITYTEIIYLMVLKGDIILCNVRKHKIVHKQNS